MGNPPGNIAPSRHALRADQVGDIFQSDHIALRIGHFIGPAGNAHQKALELAPAHHPHFTLCHIGKAGAKICEHARQFWHRLRQSARLGRVRQIQYPLGRFVQKRNIARLI